MHSPRALCNHSKSPHIGRGKAGRGRFVSKDFSHVFKANSTEIQIASSSIPVGFSIAIYALKYRAQLQQKETVLIHPATEGVGIATIQVVQSIGVEA